MGLILEKGNKMNDKFEDINDHYRRNPPFCILDDLGIYHEVEVPLPAKYIRTPYLGKEHE